MIIKLMKKTNEKNLPKCFFFLVNLISKNCVPATHTLREHTKCKLNKYL